MYSAAIVATSTPVAAKLAMRSFARTAGAMRWKYETTYTRARTPQMRRRTAEKVFMRNRNPRPFAQIYLDSARRAPHHRRRPSLSARAEARVFTWWPAPEADRVRAMILAVLLLQVAAPSPAAPPVRRWVPKHEELTYTFGG